MSTARRDPPFTLKSLFWSAAVFGWVLSIISDNSFELVAQ